MKNGIHLIIIYSIVAFLIAVKLLKYYKLKKRADEYEINGHKLDEMKTRLEAYFQHSSIFNIISITIILSLLYLLGLVLWSIK